MKGRPENLLPAELYYNAEQARKYTNCSRIIEIQAQLAERCIELLNISDPASCLILDIGCGSGLSGEVLKSSGFHWIGIDISPQMLKIAKERDPEAEVF